MISPTQREILQGLRRSPPVMEITREQARGWIGVLDDGFAAGGSWVNATALGRQIGWEFPGPDPWAEQAAEKGLGRGKFQCWLLQGLKPNVDMMGVIGTRPRGCPGHALTLLAFLGEFFRSLCSPYPTAEDSSERFRRIRPGESGRRSGEGLQRCCLFPPCFSR